MEIEKVKRAVSKYFTDLLVWQKAHQFVLSIYKLSKRFPKEELFALTSQVRRASISVPANIAEGFKKRSRQEKARFMNIAQGSLEECHYYLILVKDLGYGDTKTLLAQIEEIGKMLTGYIKALKIES
jgi:four helix bundle protein